MIKTTVVIKIDCAMNESGSGISANTIKCSDCRLTEDIPIHHTDEEFWEFQQNFLKTHSHRKVRQKQ